MSINAIATFKVKGKAIAGYVGVYSSDTFSGLANIKPVAGLRIVTDTEGNRSFDTKVRIWTNKDDDGNHYTSSCEVYTEANKEVDVIIFGTAMHERKANGQ